MNRGCKHGNYIDNLKFTVDGIEYDIKVCKECKLHFEGLVKLQKILE